MGPGRTEVLRRRDRRESGESIEGSISVRSQKERGSGGGPGSTGRRSVRHTSRRRKGRAECVRSTVHWARQGLYPTTPSPQKEGPQGGNEGRQEVLSQTGSLLPETIDSLGFRRQTKRHPERQEESFGSPEEGGPVKGHQHIVFDRLLRQD